MAEQELLRVRRENESLRHETQRLFHEVDHYRGAPPTGHAPAAMFSQPDVSRSLPPLTNGAPTGMQGVQYSEERR